MRTLLTLLLCLTAYADDSRLLAKIAEFESSNGKRLVGDNGSRLGMYHMSHAAWWDVDAARRRAGLDTVPWAELKTNHLAAREYAKDYLQILRDDFRRANKRLPTNAQLYCMWAHGFGRFKGLGFQVENAAPHIRKKARSL